MIYNEQFTSGYNDTACSLATVSNDLLNGVNLTKSSNNITYDKIFFLGVVGALNKVDFILKRFDSSINSISNTFSASDWLEKDKTTINSKINSIYDNNNGKTVITSDSRSAYNTNQILPSYLEV